MLIPNSAIEKTSSFLSGKELVKKDALDPDPVGEIVSFKIDPNGKKWKEPNSTAPDVKETKYQLSLNVNTLGEKILELNKTNLEAIVTKWGTKTPDGYDLDDANIAGKLIILQAKLENNGKHSVLIVFSDRLNASQMATVPLAQIKPVVAPVVNPSGDNEIIGLLNDIAFLTNFPVIHNGIKVNDKRDDLPKKSLQWKQDYMKLLLEIKAELVLEMANDSQSDNDFS